MTQPKQKAEALVSRIKNNISFYGQSIEEIKEDAKSIAIITCKEIIDELNDYAGNPVGDAYWGTVISEIKKIK